MDVDENINRIFEFYQHVLHSNLAWKTNQIKWDQNLVLSNDCDAKHHSFLFGKRKDSNYLAISPEDRNDEAWSYFWEKMNREEAIRLYWSFSFQFQILFVLLSTVNLKNFTRYIITCWTFVSPRSFLIKDESCRHFWIEVLSSFSQISEWDIHQ